jgi:hypothetical protein
MPPAWQNPTAALAAFLDFEEREHLFERTALGVAYWQLIRHDVFRETLEALGQSAQAHLRLEQLPLRTWLAPQLRQLPTTLARSQLWSLPRADLLVATHPRWLPHQGRYICPYSQPLLWGTSRSRLLLTGHYQGRYFSPDAGEPTRYVDLSLALSHGQFRLRELLGRGLHAHDERELNELARRLAAQLGAAPEPAAIRRRVRTAVLAQLGLMPLLSRMLDQVQPRLVVNVVGYRLVHQLLTLSARARGIPVAELQHGTIGAGHAAYNFSPGRRPATFPDYLLTFGDVFRTITPGLPLPAANVRAVGYGFLALQQGAHPGHARAQSPRKVLFISQRDIGAQLSQLAVDMKTRLPQGTLEIIYRLHPSEAQGWRERYPSLASSGIRVEEAAARGLYAAQADADVQVGVYSTALMEGIAFGLDTVLVRLPGHEQLAFLVEQNLARRADDAESLADMLEAPRLSAPHQGDQLWAPEPARRFADFVEEVISLRAG